MYTRLLNRDSEARRDVSGIASTGRPGTGAKVKGEAGAVFFTVDVIGMSAFQCLTRARLL